VEFEIIKCAKSDSGKNTAGAIRDSNKPGETERDRERSREREREREDE
jgi:hypothetical protein